MKLTMLLWLFTGLILGCGITSYFTRRPPATSPPAAAEKPMPEPIEGPEYQCERWVDMPAKFPLVNGGWVQIGDESKRSVAVPLKFKIRVLKTPDQSDTLEIQSRFTDENGAEYLCVEHARVDQLLDKAIAEALTTRESLSHQFRGDSKETPILEDLHYFEDSRDDRPMMIWHQEEETSALVFFRFKTKYASARLSIVNLEFRNATIKTMKLKMEFQSDSEPLAAVEWSGKPLPLPKKGLVGLSPLYGDFRWQSVLWENLASEFIEGDGDKRSSSWLHNSLATGLQIWRTGGTAAKTAGVRAW